MTEIMSNVAEQSQRLFAEFVERQAEQGAEPSDPADTAVFARPFQAYMEKIVGDPAKVIEAQVQLWQDYLNLWQSVSQRMAGEKTESVIEPDAGDRRFRDADWEENPVFDFIKQSYLLTTKYLTAVSQAAAGLDEKSASQVEFFTKQFADAISPTNFAATNPVVLRETARTGGENLVQGFSNLLADLERGKGNLQIQMTDTTKFELGRNVAMTPGKVVYQNDLMELIQYEPTTKTVYRRPLLIVPPWINKYYILDLRPDNSFVRWAVEKGHSVFVISWVNPDSSLAEKSFDDYLLEGLVGALDAVEAATGEHRANAIGYCLGGTLLASTLAYLAAADDARISSATFFASMTDFSEPGDLGVFIDEESVSMLDRKMAKTGYMDGAEMATTFNMLRANDLIWSFVVNNYLLGERPVPVRPSILEFRLDPHAAEHAQFLFAQDVPGEPLGRAERPHPGRTAHRSHPRAGAGLYGGNPGRSHRTVEVDLRRDGAILGTLSFHSGRVGPYRGYREPARCQEVSLLDL